MTRTVAIVQARTGSSRLPGKVLRPLGGRSALSHVLARCAAVPGVDTVCCATTILAADDAVAAEAADCGATVHRGPVDDVLARYAGAAGEQNADVILRVTSDCPAIDPALCGVLVRLRAESGAGYAANNMPPSWPHGLDCEAFTLETLCRADSEATDPFEREHVTPWMRTSPDVVRANLEAPPGLPAQTRWTLDYPEDYAFFDALYSHLPGGQSGYAMGQTLAVLAAHPEIVEINRNRHGATAAAAFGPVSSAMIDDDGIFDGIPHKRVLTR